MSKKYPAIELWKSKITKEFIINYATWWKIQEEGKKIRERQELVNPIHSLFMKNPQEALSDININKILKWKWANQYNRNKKYCTKESFELIRNNILESFCSNSTKNTLDEENCIKSLINIEGFQIITISAILTVLMPKKYAMIDVKVVSSLNCLLEYSFKPNNINDWSEYISKIRHLAKSYNTIPRALDVALWSYQDYKSNRFKKIEDVWRNSKV